MPSVIHRDEVIRVGVFSAVEAAEKAVQGLLDAGFTKEQISVICSEETKARHFAEFEQQPAGASAPQAAAAGGLIGAALGGFTALAAAAATGGVGLLVAGGLAAWTGGVFGGLVGAMMTRGVAKEPADYYDQSVVQGKILVAAEDEGPRRDETLPRASQILADAGAEPIPLREG
jgi:hypothetical protein